MITSFPQTWGQNKDSDANDDFLTDLVEYIRGQREEPFRSVKDLAATIVEKCSTIFTSDDKLLAPDPYLLEIYQEAIGAVVSIGSPRAPQLSSAEQSNNDTVSQ